MKILYKPFGIALGLAAGLVARQIASQVWGWIDKEEPPKATTKETSWGKLLFATSVQSLTMALVKVAVNRGGASTFEWLTGVWPGERVPDRE
jgi:hypothetical protein